MSKGFDYFIKLFLIFLLGSFFGLLVEETFLFVRGIIFNIDRINWVFDRSLIYGPFSPVYGIGAVVITIFFADKNYSMVKIFCISALLAGVTEYIASYIQELMYGVVSWDYTGQFLNIGGRTNIPYMLGFALISIFFVYVIYPLFTDVYKKIKNPYKTIMFTILFIFMLYNVVISNLAINRYYDRLDKIEANNNLDKFLDKYYDDDLVDNHVYKMKEKRDK